MEDENLRDTPRRWAESLVTMTSGYDFTDVKKLTTLFRKACDGDEPQACNLYAGMLLDGRGVRADREAAIRTYEKACRLHDPDACRVLKALLRKAPSGPAKAEPAK